MAMLQERRRRSSRALLHLTVLILTLETTVVHAFLGQTSHSRGNSAFVVTSHQSSSSLSASIGRTSNNSAPKRLQGCVCVVTGASRGIGKGTAIALGKEGAIVYVTGTSTSSKNMSKRSDGLYSTDDVVGGPGTIEETAQLVTDSGGQGIAVYCNHANDQHVKDLFDLVEEQQQGRLDILVNNVFRVPPGGPSRLSGKFWEQGVDLWDVLHTVGVRSHFVASCHAVPLMIASRHRNNDTSATTNSSNKYGLARPLIAMISSFGGITYSFNVPYGVGKAAVDRLAKDMAVELESEDICVTSFWPGVVKTERNENMVTSGEWDEFVGIPLDYAESPELTGRAVAAVATDPQNFQKSGTHQVVAELAEEYRFRDIDGSLPPSIRSLRFLLPTYGSVRLPDWLIPDWKLPFWVMAGGKPSEQQSR